MTSGHEIGRRHDIGTRLLIAGSTGTVISGITAAVFAIGHADLLAPEMLPLRVLIVAITAFAFFLPTKL